MHVIRADASAGENGCMMSDACIPFRPLPQSRRTFRSILVLLLVTCLSFLTYTYITLSSMTFTPLIHNMHISMTRDVDIDISVSLSDVAYATRYIPIQVQSVSCVLSMTSNGAVYPVGIATLDSHVNIDTSTQQISLRIHDIDAASTSRITYQMLQSTPMDMHMSCNTGVMLRPFNMFSVYATRDVQASTAITSTAVETDDTNTTNTTAWYEHVHLDTTQRALMLHVPWHLPSIPMFADAHVTLELPSTMYMTHVYASHYVAVRMEACTLDISPVHTEESYIPFTVGIESTPSCVDVHNTSANMSVWNEMVHNTNSSTWELVSCDTHVITSILGPHHIVTYSATSDDTVTTYSSSTHRHSHPNSYRVMPSSHSRNNISSTVM